MDHLAENMLVAAAEHSDLAAEVDIVDNSPLVAVAARLENKAHFEVDRNNSVVEHSFDPTFAIEYTLVDWVAAVERLVVALPGAQTLAEALGYMADIDYEAVGRKRKLVAAFFDLAALVRMVVTKVEAVARSPVVVVRFVVAAAEAYIGVVALEVVVVLLVAVVGTAVAGSTTTLVAQ